MKKYKNIIWLTTSILFCFLMTGCKEQLDGTISPLRWSVESCDSPSIKISSDKKSGDIKIKAKSNGEVVLKGTNVKQVYINCIYLNHEKLDYNDPGFYEDYHNGYEDKRIKVSVNGDNIVYVTITGELTDTNYIISMSDGLPTVGSCIIIEP